MNVTALTFVHGREEHLQNQWQGWLQSECKPDRWIIVGMDQDVKLPSQSSNLRQSSDIDVVISRIDGDGKLLPLAHARNHAASLCETDAMVFLDVDCIPSPQMLTIFSDAIADEDRLWMGSPRYLPAAATSDGWSTDDLARLAIAHPIQPVLEIGQRQASAEYEKFWSLCFGLRRKTFQRIGGFNESFSGYGGEDTDFAFNARKAGVPFGFVGAVSYHQHHAVCKPPLNHFDAIVRNSIQFHRRWNVWPMQSWLNAFADRGLVHFDPADNVLEILDYPTAQQIREATVKTPAGF